VVNEIGTTLHSRETRVNRPVMSLERNDPKSRHTTDGHPYLFKIRAQLMLGSKQGILLWGYGVIGNAVALQASVRGSIPRTSTNIVHDASTS